MAKLPWRDRSVQFEVNLRTIRSKPHLETIKHVRGCGPRMLVLERFLRPITTFEASPSQMKKIVSGKGTLKITTQMIYGAQSRGCRL